MQKTPSSNAPIEVPYTMPEPGVVLESYCDTSHGYMKLTISPKSIHCEYHAVTNGEAAPQVQSPYLSFPYICHIVTA
jgi:hypothetical protein